MVAVTLIRAFVALNLGLAVAATFIPRAAPGSQFITGQCKSDADCASACCGFNTGKCAGAVIAQQRDGECGFGEAEPNNKAAQAIQGPNAILPGGKGNGVANGPGGKGAKDDKDNKGDKGDGSPIVPGCKGDNQCFSGCCGSKTNRCTTRDRAEKDGGCKGFSVKSDFNA